MGWSRWPVYERVLVNLVDGSALDGLLIDKRGPVLVLGDCTLMTVGNEPALLDGDVYVEREKVLFLQHSKPKG
jgi:hypothetical protein